MGTPHDGFAVGFGAQSSEGHHEQHCVQCDEERGEPIRGEGDSEGWLPTAEDVHQHGATGGSAHEPERAKQDRNTNEQRRAARGARGWPGEPEHKRGQTRHREEEHQAHESASRPSSSARISSAARAPSPSGGGASSGAPPLRVCAAIPAKR